MTHILKTLALGATMLSISSLNAYADEPILSQNTHIAPTTTTVDVKLKGYLFGFKVMKADYKTAYSHTAYTAQAELNTSGLGAFLKKFKIWSVTRGNVVGKTMGDDFRPKVHVQQNMDKKHRRVQMFYKKDAVDVHINPQLGSQGHPPANPKQRFESYDTLTALLTLMKRGSVAGTAPCTGKIPVFDSKQHYNLRLEQAGTRRIKQKGYKGDTIRCHVFYEPVAGFDPEDLPNAEEVAAPIVMYLAHFKEANVHIPVRMTYKISGFKAVIKAREISISKTAGDNIPHLGKLNNVANPFMSNLGPNLEDE